MQRRALLVGEILIGIMLAMDCGKKEEMSVPPNAGEISEINENAIFTATGVKIRILKAESIGISPVCRFYWIQVEGRQVKEKLLEISRLALDQIIAVNPKRYHSFTFHFGSLDESTNAKDKVKYYGQTSFLPEGNWQKVGRIPIDGYKGFILEYNDIDNYQD